MTHWKTLINLDYLGAYSLEGSDKILTIKNVKKEIVTGNGGKKEECIIAEFKENEKPMILNRTNCKAITKLTGTPDIENWASKKIQIYATTTKLAGDVVECLRVRDFVKQTESEIFCELCGLKITASNGLNAEQVSNYTKKKYGKKLCSECASKLKAETKEGVEND